MEGGDLLSSGSNTCVYNPPIECADGSEIPENHVSRIVPSNSIEPKVQERVKKRIFKMNQEYLRHFNFATKICKAKFKPEDIAIPCNVEALKGKINVGESELINILTPIQESDINKKDGSLFKSLDITIEELRHFLHALVEMNSYAIQVFHIDAHLGNFSWKGDNIVLHDWEKAKTGDNNMLNYLINQGLIISNYIDIEYINKCREESKKFEAVYFIINTLPFLDEAVSKLLKRYNSENANPLSLFEQGENNYPHMLHRIYFRFIDIISILGGLMRVFIQAEIKTPEFYYRIYESLMRLLNDRFNKCLELDDKHFDSNENTIEFLNTTTQEIHNLIDISFKSTKGGFKKYRQNTYKPKKLRKRKTLKRNVK
jgi:hypothetical protein